MIHILAYGAALCGMKGVPRDWPEGHRWIGFFDAQWREHATCPECIAAAKKHENDQHA